MFSGGEKTPSPRNSLPSCDSKQYQLQKGSRIEPGTNYKTRTTKVMLGGWKCLKWQAWTGKNSCVILKQVTVALEKGSGFIVSTDGARFCNCSFHSILFHNSSLEWWKYPNCSHTLIAVIVKFHMPMKYEKMFTNQSAHCHCFLGMTLRGVWESLAAHAPSRTLAPPMQDFSPSLTCGHQKENLESDDHSLKIQGNVRDTA